MSDSEKNVGWICPKCGASVNPDVKVCPSCKHEKVTEGDKPEGDLLLG